MLCIFSASRNFIFFLDVNLSPSLKNKNTQELNPAMNIFMDEYNNTKCLQFMCFYLLL